MDRRYRRAWQNVDARRQSGEPLAEQLPKLPDPQLVETLAGAGGDDPVATNVIAVELLNRLRRSRWLFLSVPPLLLGLLLFPLDSLADGPYTTTSTLALASFVCFVVSAAYAAVIHVVKHDVPRPIALGLLSLTFGLAAFPTQSVLDGVWDAQDRALGALSLAALLVAAGLVLLPIARRRAAAPT